MKTSECFQFCHFRLAVRLPHSETRNRAAQGPCDVQTPEIWIQHFKSSRDAKEEGGVVRMSEEEKSKGKGRKNCQGERGLKAFARLRWREKKGIIRVMKEGGVVKTFPSLFGEGAETFRAYSNFCRGNIWTFIGVQRGIYRSYFLILKFHIYEFPNIVALNVTSPLY